MRGRRRPLVENVRKYTVHVDVVRCHGKGRKRHLPNAESHAQSNAAAGSAADAPTDADAFAAADARAQQAPDAAASTPLGACYAEEVVLGHR